MADEPDPKSARREDELSALRDKISKARGEPVTDRSAQTQAASRGYRMATDFIAAVLVGAAMGYGLDVLLGTTPWMIIVMLLFGFAAGVKMIMREAERTMQDDTAIPAGENKDRDADA